MKTTLESDWKKYNKLIPLWRDSYLQRKNQMIIDFLSDPTKTPTEKFWETKDKIYEQAQIMRACLGYNSRSKMWTSILSLYQYGFIVKEDLEEFSEELRNDVISCSKNVANG